MAQGGAAVSEDAVASLLDRLRDATDAAARQEALAGLNGVAANSGTSARALLRKRETAELLAGLLREPDCAAEAANLLESCSRAARENSVSGLSRSPGAARALRDSGCIQPLVELVLSSAEPQVLQASLGTLLNVAEGDAACLQLVPDAEKLVARLFALLRQDGDPYLKRLALGVLARLAEGEAGRAAVRGTPGSVTTLCLLAASREQAIYAARALESISADHELRLQVADSGAVEVLADGLEAGATSAVAGAAAGALRSLAANSGSSAASIRARIAHAGCIPKLVALIGAPGSEQTQVTLNATGALCNLADSPLNRCAITQAGAVESLLRLLQCPIGNEVTAVAAGTLRNLSIDNQPGTESVRLAGGIPHLVKLLRAGPEEDATLQAAGALCNIADSEENRDAIREAGGICPLVNLLVNSSDMEMPSVAAGALRNLAASNPANATAIVDAGGVPPLVTLLSAGPEEEVTLQALCALSNLAECWPGSRTAIRNIGGIPLIVGLLQNGPGREQVVTFAAAAAQNVLSRDTPNCQAFAKAGGIPMLLELLEGRSDAEATASAIGALLRLGLCDWLKPQLKQLQLAERVAPIVRCARLQSTQILGLLVVAVVYACADPPNAAASVLLEKFDIAAHLVKLVAAATADDDAGFYYGVAFAPADVLMYVRIVSADQELARHMAELGAQSLLIQAIKARVGGSVGGAEATRALWQITLARCAQGACGFDWWLLSAVMGKKPQSPQPSSPTLVAENRAAPPSPLLDKM